MIGDCICLECKEKFENKTQAHIHHIYTKHENYHLIDTDVDMTVKTVAK